MSLILEALKKSEIERQRGQTPTVFTPVLQESFPQRSAFKQKLPWILLAVFTLIAVAAWWANTRNVSAPVTAAADAENATIAPDVPIQTAPIVIEKPAPVVNEKPIADVSPPVIDTQPAPPPAVVQTPPAAVMPPIQPAETATPVVMQDDALPLAVLSSELRQQLPPMKYTMHVYSNAARDRFAIVDGTRVSEGSLIGPAVVTQIRRDGLVIEWNGARYLVAKP